MKYKVGDKVKVKSIEWYNANKSKYGTVKCSEAYFQPTMSKLCGNILTIKNIDKTINAYIVEENSYYWVDDMFESLVEEKTTQLLINGIIFPNKKYADKVELCLGDDYEIVVEDGKTFVQKKKSKYPTTYEECCSILGISFTHPYIREVSVKEYYLYSSFIQLIRCRNAYWKIAGEEMGLGKPWEFENPAKRYVFTIEYYGGNIILNAAVDSMRNRILVFPTEEMRDAFYKNFKDLIEQVIELL